MLIAAIAAAMLATGAMMQPADFTRSGRGAMDNPMLAASSPVASVPSAEWQPSSSRQPSYDPDQSLGHRVFTLRIPAIDVVETVRAGMDLAVIDQGPAHWVGTASPGRLGNVVLAGHRTTHSRPFYALDRLEYGDLVYLTDGSGFDVIYRVVETFIVEPDEVWITYDNGQALLTMFACHPKGSAAQRIVVRATLVAGRLIA